MRRVATSVYCIGCLLAWLLHAPVLHAHTAEDGGMVHAHFDNLEVEHHAHPDLPAFDHPDADHHGIEATVFFERIMPSTVLFGEIGDSVRLADPTDREGAVFDKPMRGRDPPLRLSSSPRSPPA